MSSELEPLVAAYYQADSTPGLSPGQICWAPITFVEPDYQVALLAGTVPSDDSATTYRVVPYSKGQHNLQPPVFALKLRAGEVIRAARMKRRPAIVLSSRVDQWKDKGGTATRHSEKARLLIPLYTISDYSAAWTDRVRRFEYNSHFFLPANLLPGGTPNRDVFLRFEQCQCVNERLIEPCNFRLDDEALDFVLAWFEYWCRGQHNEISNLLAQFYDPAA
jgi:hypothetical protein